MRSNLMLLYFAFTIVPGLAQKSKGSMTSDPVSIYNSRYHTISSKFVNQKFAVMIGLPENYGLKDAKYPVVYMTDANAHFGMMTDIARSLQGAKEMPDAIIVGITYPSEQKKMAGTLRLRDYTPASNAQMDERMDTLRSGGGPEFLKFVGQELIPFIESLYRVKPEQRTFVGFSIAGLLAINWALTMPGLFQQYIIGSPSIWYDQKSIFRLEETYASLHKDLKLKIFMSIGSKEGRMVQDMEALSHLLGKRNYPGLRLQYAVLQDETHASTVSGCFQQGLRFLFGPASN